jgi:adenosylhomocysteinase
MASPDSVDPLGWTRDYTPILRSFANTYRDDQPFAGYSIAVASHLEAKTGILIETLNEAGAEVLVTSSEPYSTHGDVVTALGQRDGIKTYVNAGMSEAEWTEGQHTLLEDEPDIILDDGCELIAKIHADHPEIADTVLGGAEQTISCRCSHAPVIDEEALATAAVDPYFLRKSTRSETLAWR